MPSSAPRNVQGYATSSTSIRVSWISVAAAQRNGIINFYTVRYIAVAGAYRNGTLREVEVSGASNQIDLRELEASVK